MSVLTLEQKVTLREQAKITLDKNVQRKRWAHPYHLAHTNSASNVYGWVDEGTFD